MDSKIVSTIAGNGTTGFNGDGLQAALTKFWFGAGALCIDTFGNLYIADENNQRIRMVDSNNIVHTIVGNGIAGYAGDGGPATIAMIKNPEGVAVDIFGNIYIADFFNNRIRKVTYRNLNQCTNSIKIIYSTLIQPTIYPNPATTTLTFTNTSNTESIYIYNMYGQLVLTKRLYGEGSIEINVEYFATGVYMVVCIGKDGERVVRRVVK